MKIIKPMVPKKRKGNREKMTAKKTGTSLVMSMWATLHAEVLEAYGNESGGVVSLRPTASSARSFL